MLHNNSFHSWFLLHIPFSLILTLYANPVKHSGSTAVPPCFRGSACAYIRIRSYIFMHTRFLFPGGGIDWSAGSFPAGRRRAFPIERKVGSMRICVLKSLAFVLGGLILGILVFILLFIEALTLVPPAAAGIAFFILVTVLAGGGLLALAAGILRAERTPALTDAWLCCGNLAAIGAVGTLLTALITFLTGSLGVGFYIGVALTFFFLFLLLGGIVCFLHRYLTVRFNGCC